MPLPQPASQPSRRRSGQGARAQLDPLAHAAQVLSDAKSRQYYDRTGSTEGIDVSAEDFLAAFYGVMQESMGGMSIQVRRRRRRRRRCRLGAQGCCRRRRPAAAGAARGARVTSRWTRTAPRPHYSALVVLRRTCWRA
jgi:DnaJ-class molecular chaperone